MLANAKIVGYIYLLKQHGYEISILEKNIAIY